MKPDHLFYFIILILALPVLGDDAVQKDGSIIIKPGDSFIVQFDRAGEKLSNPRIVQKMTSGTPCIRLQCASGFSDAKATPPKPDSLLTFMLGEDSNQTILLVQKNLPEDVAYVCYVKPAGSAF